MRRAGGGGERALGANEEAPLGARAEASGAGVGFSRRGGGGVKKKKKTIRPRTETTKTTKGDVVYVAFLSF